MKNIWVPIILILAFLMPITNLPAVKAETSDISLHCIISTPTNRTYYQENLPLKVALNYLSQNLIHVNITYSLDNQTTCPIQTTQSKHGDNRTITGLANLSKLSLGQHKITVCTQRIDETQQKVVYSEKTIFFSIAESRDTDWSFITTTFNKPVEYQTYNSKQLALNISVEWYCANLYKVSYSLDGQDWHYLPVNLDLSDPMTSLAGRYPEIDTLPVLSEGKHNLTVCIEGQWGYSVEHRTKQSTVHFTIDTIYPQISNVSLQQSKIYNQSELPLACTVNEVTSWVGYSIDNIANVTLCANATIKPSVGSHSLVIYANDTAGNMGKSATITFTIVTNLSVIFLASIIGVIILVVALLVYYRRCKHSNAKV
jgi:hypothetical protein